VAGFELQLAATPIDFDSMDIKHVGSFVFAFSVRSDLLAGLMPGEHLSRRHPKGADGLSSLDRCAFGHVWPRLEREATSRLSGEYRAFR
ncbi:MAG: hypothetical protein J0H37_02515, partial [Hyphomicrobium denitrificans]|nr:hypothetical protein [Hyphomicrobium denitrificans]